VHLNDAIVIYLTGLGATAPAVDDGMPAPASPLASAMVTPALTLGGKPLDVFWAGLVPGYVGLYQINAMVPGSVPQGLDIPLVISQGGNSTALSVRVVK
jgi:adhesin/invasin